jgi:ribosomal protein S18 acetylase RimI-like enzyme
MHYRNAERTDIPALLKLYREVASKSGMIARKEHEITIEFIEDFIDKSLRDGLIIVGEDEAEPGELIAEIHASKPGIELFEHVFSDLTILVHPRFQDKGIGRTIFTIFLDEIANHRPDVGRVELMTGEYNKRALHLYQSLGFVIEGRFEMRMKTETGFAADIALWWQNPGFEFDGEIPRLNRQ